MKKYLLFLLVMFSINTLAQPVLRIIDNKLNFDTTLIKTTKTKNIRLQNSGNSNLEIQGIDSICLPFSNKSNFPIIISPNETKTISIDYSPIKPNTVDSQNIYIKTNSVSGVSVALLFDVSGSMSEWLSLLDTKSKIEVAHQAGESFIDALFNLKNIAAEAGIFSFSDDFYINHSFSTDKASLKNSLPTQPLGTTCLYLAMSETINQLRPRTYRKFMVVLSDGGDNCFGGTPSDVISNANLNNVTIFTIGVGDADSTQLKLIAERTGGEYFTTQNSNELIEFYKKIPLLVRNNIIELKGSSYSDSITFSINEIITSKIGDTIYFPVRLQDIIVPAIKINDVSFTINYDKNSLFPLTNPIITKNTLTQDYNNLSYKNEYLNSNGILNISFSGGNLINYKKDSVFTRTGFIVLRNSVQSSNLYLSNIKISNPKIRVGILNPGIVKMECFCFNDIRSIKFDENEYFKLNQNSPNPFNPSTLIKFQIKQKGIFKMFIFDLLGREVKKLFENYLETGNYQYEFNASYLPTGVYLYRLQSDFNSEIKKMIYVK